LVLAPQLFLTKTAKFWLRKNWISPKTRHKYVEYISSKRCVAVLPLRQCFTCWCSFSGLKLQPKSSSKATIVVCAGVKGRSKYLRCKHKDAKTRRQVSTLAMQHSSKNKAETGPENKKVIAETFFKLFPQSKSSIYRVGHSVMQRCIYL